MKISAFLILCIFVFVEGHPRKYRHFDRVVPDQHGPIAPKTQKVHQEYAKIRTLTLQDMGDILEVNKNHGSIGKLSEGDILREKETRNTIVDPTLFWTTLQVPIEYSNEISLLAKAAIDEARREYELRTCFSFVPRTNEENYILFEPLQGCYSYVGMQGGAQTISIGRGCEQMATVQHEMMHALGIWHEQSRPDRDDYVNIIWADISPTQWHNFFKYTYNETDDRRVAYDFNSVMHYDKTAFTSNGNITIQTRDPFFEDVIGQRSTFSDGDVKKIQRMYDCSDTARISNSINFEQEGVGGFSEYNTNGDVSWIRHDVANSDTSGATTKYLPKFDNTFGRIGYGSFIYLDTSVKIPGLAGTIKSMRYKTTVARQCLEFSYYMDVVPGSQAALTAYVASIDQTTGVITSYGVPLVTFTGSYGNRWNVQRMTISAESTYRIVFTAKTGGYSTDIIAIDDVAVVDKECDTSYFIVPDYTNILDTFPLNSSFVSPTMYTGAPGYAFQLLVYPTGRDTPGYTSIFFQLVGGIYDDQLQWPFDKQFIRFVITDQGPDPLTRMNYYYNFLTDSTSILLGSSWDKPEGINSINPGVGYSTFMNNNRFYTRNFLKHDTAYYSVQVTDMRPYQGNDTDISVQIANPVLRSAQDIPDLPEIDFIPDEDHHHEHHEHPSPVPEEEKDDGMMSIEMAALMILLSCGVVFIAMSILICVVAQSHRKRVNDAPIVMNNIGNPSRGQGDMRYSKM